MAHTQLVQINLPIGLVEQIDQHVLDSKKFKDRSDYIRTCCRMGLSHPDWILKNLYHD